MKPNYPQTAKVTNKEVAAYFARGFHNMYSDNMCINGDIVYSYGKHFPLAIRGPVYYVNGDRYSNTTSRHQSLIRAALAAEGIPYELATTEQMRAMAGKANEQGILF